MKSTPINSRGAGLMRKAGPEPGAAAIISRGIGTTIGSLAGFVMALRWSMIVVGVCGWLAAAAALAQGPEREPAARPEGRRFALLVGCTKYSALGPRYALQGPANDVALFERLLRDRFRFAETDIVRLVHTNPEAGQPRRANIVREMDRLVQEARAGDEVLILLSGHGSQQPDQTMAKDGVEGDEEDGLDEVFLPEDVKQPVQEAPTKRVPGIADDQLEAWLTALREHGAFVFFVVDTCHSGTMSRAADDDAASTTFRFVPREELATAEELAAAAAGASAKPQAKDDVAVKFGAAAGASRGGLAALYAVPPQALEQEHAMPPPSAGASEPRYGRLSYALNQVLLQAPAPLTYRELAQQITWQYRRWNWFPRPVLEASSLDREVLDKREWRDRSALLLTRTDDGVLQLNQGLAHGITIGSVMRVEPGVKVEPVGHVRVVGAGPMSATVEPTAFGNAPLFAAEKLVVPSRCEVVEVDYGRLQLSVRVLPLDAKLHASMVDRVQTLIAESAARKDSVVRPAAVGEAADVALLVGEKSVALRWRGEVADGATKDSAKAELFGPYPIDDERRPALLRDLRQIALVRNMYRLADAPEQNKPPSGKQPFGLKIDVERAAAGGGDWKTVDDVADARFADGDLLRIRLRNVGLASLDATVLYVDSRLGVRSHYPTLRAAQAGTYNTLAPRSSHEVTIKINDGTTGPEDVLVLAVLHEPPVSAHFAFLEQPGLTRADLRSLRGGARSPLDELLGASLGGGRGASRVDGPTTFAIRRIPLEVVPPQAKK